MQQKPLRELLNLQGKTAIVTGGAKGIGYAIAYRLAEAGAKVLIADIDVDGEGTAITNMRVAGFQVESVLVNVSKEEDVVHMVEICTEKFGQIDILVNNAGIYPFARLSQLTSAEFQRVTHVNMLGAFFATKHVVDRMKTTGGGKIINITSSSTIRPMAPGLSHYDASKEALLGFTKSLAVELAEHAITVNAIAPGAIQTPGTSGKTHDPASQAAFLKQIPMGRIGQADEVAKVALFLASDMSSYITGSQIVADGGVVLT